MTNSCFTYKTEKIMKFYIISLFCFFRFLGIAQSSFQKESITYNQINLLNSEYKDFVSVKNKIYAISQKNDLIVINIKDNSFKLIKNNIAAIAKKSNGEVVFGSKNGEIFTLNKRQKVKQIEKIDAEIFSIVINSKDEYVIYSNKSIYYNRKEYIPKRETNFYGKVRAKKTGKQLIEPDYIYLDKMNFIWFTYDEGEWGGNVCFFDLNKKEFIYDDWLRLEDSVKYKDRYEYFTKLKEKYPEIIKVTEKDTIYQYPFHLGISCLTKGATYDNKNNLFVSSSGGSPFYYENLKGFSYLVDGTLVKISKKEKDYFKSCFDEKFLIQEKYKEAFGESLFSELKSKKDLRDLKDSILTENEINILGSIAFNKFYNKIYMYSSKGFFVLNNLDCNFTKKFIFKPNVICKVQYETDHCIHLNVVKFEFIGKKEILFLTVNNGIGYYNGENVKYFR